MVARGVVLILTVAVLALASPAHANLITNPGFETGNFDGWIQFGDTGFTFVNGEPHSGAFAAWLGPVGSLGFLMQIVPTTPGVLYNLSYFLQSDGFTPNEFQVSWNGSPLSDQLNLPASGYAEQTFTNLLATSATTPLIFGFRNDPGFLQLDDVAVSPVPEPATLLLLGTTMAGVGLATRRKRSPSR